MQYVFNNAPNAVHVYVKGKEALRCLQNRTIWDAGKPVIFLTAAYLVIQYVFCLKIPIGVQVYIKGDEAPRCLHEWTPHDGKPVTSLIFLDDHSQE